jgi:hypothetical protein
MSNPEPEAEPVIPPTVPDRDLGPTPMTPEEFRRLLCRRYPSTSDVARYLTRDHRVSANGRSVAGDQSHAADKDDTERLGVVVNMPARSFDGTDGSDNQPNWEPGGGTTVRHTRPPVPQ